MPDIPVSETRQQSSTTSLVRQQSADELSVNGIGLLLQTTLKNHRKLALDSDQIAALSRLYWTPEPSGAGGTIEAIERTLSSEQFRQAVTDFAAAPVYASAPTTPTAEIGTLIKAALDERTKDKDVLSVDLAAKAADRLMSWTRMFAYFVAAPVAVILAGLSLFGYSKLQDVREIAASAEVTLRTAQQNVTAITARSKQVDDQLAALGQHVDKNDQQIRSLDNTVRSLAEKLDFGPASDLPESLQKKLTQAADSYLRYFEKFGYVPKTTSVNLSTKVNIPGALSYYDSATNSIVMQKEVAEDETILLREYSHHILYSALSFNALDSNTKWKSSAVPIEYGLADYFIASFRNQPVLYALAAQRLKVTSDAAIPVNLENRAKITTTQFGDRADYMVIYRLEPAWGGVFWELRQALGQGIVDKCLYEAWRTLADQDDALVAHSFIANIASQLKSSAGPPAIKTLRDILSLRGISASDLPDR